MKNEYFKDGGDIAEAEPNESKTVVVNPAEYKFVDFSETILRNASDSEKNSPILVRLRELDGKIYSTGQSDKYTFADDRLVYSAYHIMCNTEVFEERTASIREWIIVQRYFDAYLPDSLELKDELKKVVNTYIGFTFSNAEMSDEQERDVYKSMKLLEKQVFKDDYPVHIPPFVLNVIETKKIEAVMPEREQYEQLKKVAEYMIAEGVDVRIWEKALKQANKKLK